MIKLSNVIISFALLCLSGHLCADAPKWRIVPADSSIRFTGTQNNAPVTGEFKKFEGDIKFDPSHLKESRIKLTIDMNSVSAGFSELANMLKTQDWFDSVKFPQAIFESKEITARNGVYQIKGDLQVRDKHTPIIIEATVEENTPQTLKIRGTTLLSRTQLGIGQGEWANTSEIKEDVKVNFSLELKR